MIKILYKLVLVTLFIRCSSTKNTIVDNNKIKELRFIGEQIIKPNTIFKGTKVGGLSGIDYNNGKYYLISDDKSNIRFYEMKFTYDKNSFSKVKITDVIKVKGEVKNVDPESLRFDKTSSNFYWSSEGFIKKGEDPKIFESTINGDMVNVHETPNIFKVKNNSNTVGVRRNGTFEGLSMSVNPNFYWVSMELPLKQDGNEPQLEKGKYPVRISKIHKKTGELVYQFAHMLDEIPKNAIPENEYKVNGCTEILALDQSNFILIERAFAFGHKNGGNTVKLYLVNCTNATDISKIKSLKDNEYVAATKTLLFNFEQIRSKLTNGMVDNIEGITFGKVLDNGNRTIVVVSDNNFNYFGSQLNQLIVLEVIE